jgi:hypothetical protein
MKNAEDVKAALRRAGWTHKDGAWRYGMFRAASLREALRIHKQVLHTMNAQRKTP